MGNFFDGDLWPDKDCFKTKQPILLACQDLPRFAEMLFCLVAFRRLGCGQSASLRIGGGKRILPKFWMCSSGDACLLLPTNGTPKKGWFHVGSLLEPSQAGSPKGDSSNIKASSLSSSHKEQVCLYALNEHVSYFGQKISSAEATSSSSHRPGR